MNSQKTIQTHYSKLLNHGENLETLGSSNLRHLKQSEIRRRLEQREDGRRQDGGSGTAGMCLKFQILKKTK